jgi:hypothetical protein
MFFVVSESLAFKVFIIIIIIINNCVDDSSTYLTNNLSLILN